MKKLLIIIIFLVLAINVNALTLINEIMYNPESEDNNKEFIEIYSNEISNFENYSIEDLSGGIDTLTRIKETNSSYSLIVEDGFDYNNIDASVYIIGNTIGNGLNNDQDFIIFRNNEREVIDLFYYNSDFGGDNNGRSLERVSFNGFSNDKENWVESEVISGTPGRENELIDLDFSDLKINEFLADPAGNDNANMPNGEFIEIYNKGDENLDLSRFYLEDKFGHRINFDDTHMIDTLIEGEGYSVLYANGFEGFLNNDEDEIKFYYSNILIDKVSYSSTREGFSYSKIDNEWINTNPTPLEDNSLGRVNENSFVEIVDYDENVKFGDLIEIKLNIYKADTRKNAINLVIENEDYRISEIVNFNIFGKYINYTITVPAQIYPNCNGKYKEGEYKIKVTGLEENDEKKIKVFDINRKMCNIITEKVGTNEANTLSGNDDSNHEDSSIQENQDLARLNPKVVYESSDIKAKNSVYFIFITTLIIVIVFLVFRKGL
ncbi:MAG: lamin tail domain-containing protein [Nanoarchaeota archaeon]